jgi:acyl carrier protein
LAAQGMIGDGDLALSWRVGGSTNWIGHTRNFMNKRERIMAIVGRISNKSTPPNAEESLFDAGYLDSFALTDMVSELEKEFKIRIPDSDLTPHRFESIARIEEYIGNHSA